MQQEHLSPSHSAKVSNRGSSGYWRSGLERFVRPGAESLSLPHTCPAWQLLRPAGFGFAGRLQMVGSTCVSSGRMCMNWRWEGRGPEPRRHPDWFLYKEPAEDRVAPTYTAQQGTVIPLSLDGSSSWGEPMMQLEPNSHPSVPFV